MKPPNSSRTTAITSQRPLARKPSAELSIPKYLYYTLGKLEIFKLREDYRKQEGDRLYAPEIPRRDAAARSPADSASCGS